MGKFKTGATPSPRHVLATAKPFRAAGPPPAAWCWLPKQISMWLNDTDGDCVTASEAFKAACFGVFISDQTVGTWATAHGVLNGAIISDVLDWMVSDGFQQDGNVYCDGGKSSVDWTNQSLLQAAIAAGPVKIGVAAAQLQQAVTSTGWIGTGFKQDNNYDHCVELTAYGSAAWLAQQLSNWYGVSVQLGNLSPNAPVLGLATWNTVGIIDIPSMIDITCEAWSRTPNSTVRGSNPPTPDQVFTPGPINPPPPPSPLPPPPIGVIAAINAAFVQIEAQFARVRGMRHLLEQIRQYVVAYMQAHGFQTVQSGTIPPSVISMIDAAFGAAELAYPAYAPIIALVKTLVDQYLPMV